MRTALIVLAVLCLLIGGVWILQGVGVLPGSFMTGQIEWAYAGFGTVLVGGVLLWVGGRTGRRERE